MASILSTGVMQSELAPHSILKSLSPSPKSPSPPPTVKSPSPLTGPIKDKDLDDRLDTLEESFKDVDKWGLDPTDENALLNKLIDDYMDAQGDVDEEGAEQKQEEEDEDGDQEGWTAEDSVEKMTELIDEFEKQISKNE